MPTSHWSFRNARQLCIPIVRLFGISRAFIIHGPLRSRRFEERAGAIARYTNAFSIPQRGSKPPVTEICKLRKVVSAIARSDPSSSVLLVDRALHEFTMKKISREENPNDPERNICNPFRCANSPFTVSHFRDVNVRHPRENITRFRRSDVNR